MINIQNKGDCSGCHACMAACPKGAIVMQPDTEGFLYPEIDRDICVECGICDNMCQAKKPIRLAREPHAYACWNKDENVRMNSSSGGMFHLLAKWMIQKGGVVFGAAFDDDFNIRHIGVRSVEDIRLLQGSKYVQSVIGNTYLEAKEELESGNYVLFTGTPCQIDGLLHYLRKDYEKLYTQDIICHGVPSSKVWQRYLEYQKEHFKSTLKRDSVPSFRQKRDGWNRYAISLPFEKGIEYRVFHREDFYMQAFLNNLSLRPSCYECHSKTKHRNSDITLADFWGIENVLPEMFDNKGTSLVLTNSEKGQSLFEEIRKELVCQEVDFEEAISHNSCAYRSVKKPDKREDFFLHLSKMQFDRLVKRETLPPLYERIYWKIRCFLSKGLRKCGIRRR